MAKKIIYDGGKGVVGKALAQSLNLFENAYVWVQSLEQVEQGLDKGEVDSVLFVTPDRETAHEGNRLRKKAMDTPFVFLTLAGERLDETRRAIRGEHCSATSLVEILKRTLGSTRIEPKLKRDYGFAFEADPKGLTAVLMDQFSEPLLCFRELVQNSVDADSSRIAITAGYDKAKQLLDVQVVDDGAGMTADHIRTYLTLFDSTKDTDIKKIGQMGAGKVFAHALKPRVMTVETGDGEQGHRVIFNPDLSGKILETEPFKGTNVRLLIPMNRAKARAFNKKLEGVVKDWCKYVKTPLFVNGSQINKPFDIQGNYVERISEAGLEAVIALGRSNYDFFKGRILLEEDSYIYSEDYEQGNITSLFGGLVDAETLDFPISRNGVVRNQGFDRTTAKIKEFIVERFTPRFIEDFVNGKVPKPEQGDVKSFFYHILANRGYGRLDKEVLDTVRGLPILKNADGSYLSVEEVRKKIEQHGCLYYTSKGLGRTELSAFLDKGIPVLRDPAELVKRQIFGGVHQQCLDDRYYRGEMLRQIGAFDFYAINDLLTRGFVSKVSASSMGGGFLGAPVNSQGTFDNPFDFSRLRVYGADFKDLQGNPEENILLDSYWSGDYNNTHNIVFNINHPFMRNMESLARQNQKLAHYFIACELIKSKKVFDRASHRLREHEMSRIGLKAVDNE